MTPRAQTFNHGSVQALLEDYAVVYDYATTVGKPVTIELVQRALVDAQIRPAQHLLP